MIKPFDVLVNYCNQGYRVIGSWYSGTPGQISGPPEHCYPPEPSEIDVKTLIFYSDDGTQTNITGMLPALSDDFWEHIEADVEDAMSDDYEGEEDFDYDDERF